MAYRVSEVDLDARGETLTSLWRENLGATVPFARKLDWYYKDNPQGRADALLLEHSEGRKLDADAATVQGCIGIGRRNFFVGGDDAIGAVFIDFAVNKAHRTLFPALMLQRAAQKLAHERYSFGYGIPNDNAIGLFKHMRYHEVGRMQRYARILHHAEFVGRVVKSGLLSRAGGALLDAATDARDMFAGVLDRRHRFEWITPQDVRLDDLWHSAKSYYGVVGDRSREVLKWRFGSIDEERCKMAALVDAKSGRLEAYAAVRGSGKNARVVDLFGHLHELTPLLRALCHALRASEYTAVSIQLFAGPLVLHKITEAGFSLRETLHSVVVDPAKHPAAELLRSRDNWFLTDGDQDGG